MIRKKKENENFELRSIVYILVRSCLERERHSHHTFIRGV